MSERREVRTVHDVAEGFRRVLREMLAHAREHNPELYAQVVAKAMRAKRRLPETTPDP